ncbi:sugar-binding transcriptional regulator [Jannaschia sp. Os4]|uniref:sugar-binding transcriptional regulator n=1 Tax=Jannaschia sp. Os4 TaxID=2807617 RepID=UPI001939B4D8|nr:sugar-binding transcriptional regulator [Jannaschia sp. Os4]MBM2574904.1 sugar-binding transcriptional regulator [Jannaschia sp. Os4]
MTDPRLDDAARAGWLYYVAGRTQDEIARNLGVSRQKAQRLVSQAAGAGLVKVRLDHPIARCMELGAALRDRWGLRLAEVVPSDPDAPGLLSGVAAAAAVEIERVLAEEEPRILALGTGRTVVAAVEQVDRMERPQHRIVSLLGDMMRDGSASPFGATGRLAERVGARHYPMALPVFASDPEERAMLHAQAPVASTLALCARADAVFVGLASVGPKAPMVADGFASPAEVAALTAQGAVGEITGHPFDADGALLGGDLPERITAAPLEPDSDRPTTVIAVGQDKVAGLRGALRGRLADGIITDEATASSLLEG